MFWLLGERWGTVGPEGITIPLPLTHETVAMIIGVRRPAATLGLQRLASAGLLLRRGSNRWLLTNQAVTLLDAIDSFELIDGDPDGSPALADDGAL